MPNWVGVCRRLSVTPLMIPPENGRENPVTCFDISKLTRGVFSMSNGVTQGPDVSTLLAEKWCLLKAAAFSRVTSPSVTWKMGKAETRMCTRLGGSYRKTDDFLRLPGLLDIRSDGREVFVHCDAIISAFLPLHLRFNAACSLVDGRAIILSSSGRKAATIGEWSSLNWWTKENEIRIFKPLEKKKDGNNHSKISY